MGCMSETRYGRYKRRKRERGICTDCTEPVAAHNSWYCERHAEYHAARSLAYWHARPPLRQEPAHNALRIAETREEYRTAR